jgi:hypothetical protein
MGYIGRVSVFGRVVRALSSSLAAKQAIQHPDVVDGRIDRTLYQLGPVEVDGDVAIPIVQSGQSTAFMQFIWDIATKRNSLTGELMVTGPVTLEYSFQQSRRFNECRANTLEMRATAGDRVEATINFMGTTADDGIAAEEFDDVSPAKVLTWDNVKVFPSDPLFQTCIVREFTFNINNNCSRNYTFCPETGLFASNISTGKRFIQGTLGFQGFAPTDAKARTNSTSPTPHAGQEITFDFAGFTRTFKNILYEFQGIDINVGLITSSVNWYAHQGTARCDYAATGIECL